MDNTQVEVYKFKMSYIKDFFVDLFGNSNSENDELIEKEAAEANEDSAEPSQEDLLQEVDENFDIQVEDTDNESQLSEEQNIEENAENNENNGE